MKKLLVPLAMMLVLGCAAQAAEVCSTPVSTASGQVSGEAQNNSCVWRGIPFAAPPTGELRWKAPRPAAPWSGVRPATEFANICMQSGIMAAESKVSRLPMSEDCLYLNIWRPQKSGTFPVMFWVHGGGYTGGSGTTEWYWGDRLAGDHDVVVVTINYRLNLFGFFAHEKLRAEDPHGSTGSYGTLDQVAALQWVHDNIANFGGDPARITIFGESAGGFSVCTLLATPLARGLFAGAILESGGCDVAQDVEKGYPYAREFMGLFNCGPEDLACLRAVPAAKLMEHVEGMTGLRYRPHTDGYVLTDTPLAMIKKGDFAKVPFIAGYNRDEFGKAIKLMRRDLRRTPPAAYESTLIEQFKVPAEEAKTLVALYPLSEYDNRPIEAYGRMFGGDASLRCPTYLGLQAAAGQGAPSWLYSFEYDGYRLGKYMGSAHAMEIPFIFGSLDRLPASFFYDSGNIKEARALQQVVQGYVLNFVRTGDPNGGGLAAWPGFDASRMAMVFDVQSGARPAGMEEKCAFWERFSREHKGSMESLGASDRRKKK